MANKKPISYLKTGDSITEDIDIIRDHILSYYKDLFAGPTHDLPNLDSFLELIPRLVNDDHNTCLTKIPSYEEVRKTVFDMGPDSAPGLDGFGGIFNQKA